MNIYKIKDGRSMGRYAKMLKDVSHIDCDRCRARIGESVEKNISFFTDEIICSDCSCGEDQVKYELGELGIESKMNGCGFVPNIMDIIRGMN